MRVAGKHVNGFYLRSAHLKAQHLVRADPALLNQPVPRHNHKKLPLAVMPMLPLGHARFGNIDADLPAVFGFQQLGKAAAGIPVHFQRERHLFFGQVGKIHGIQLLLKAPVRNFGDDQRFRLVVKAVKALRDIAQRCPVGNGRGAVSAARGRHGTHAVKLTMMLPALQRVKHFLHQVVDKQQFQLHRRVVHRDRQVICNVVAERAHRAVIVGAHPFAHQIREAVNQHPRAGFLSVSEKQLLPRLFGKPVFRGAEAPRKRCLNRRRKHHRAFVAVFFQGIQQSGGKTEVARAELRRILRAVDPGKMEHKIRLPAVFVQLLCRAVDVIFVDLTNVYIRAGAVFAVTDVFQVFTEIAPHKALGAGNQNVHGSFLHTILLTTPVYD